ncbi:MAG: DUF948 domain-containing protein [Actinomycetaceae bacterium]|nr:DUF948 domain-containing protein [Actinomycetaceae bacterium]
MSLGSIAGLIAAVAFAILVAVTAVPLIKLGRVFDELRVSIKDVTVNANETLSEANKVVRDTGAQLTRVDAVTTSAAQVAQDVSALSALTSATLGAPLIKIAAFSHAARRVLRAKKGGREDS